MANDELEVLKTSVDQAHNFSMDQAVGGMHSIEPTQPSVIKPDKYGQSTMQNSYMQDRKTQAYTNNLGEFSKEQTVSVIGPKHDITIDDR